MSEDRDALRARLEDMFRAMIDDGVAGGMIGPDGVRVGVPDWEEVTKDQRFAEKVKTHGWPPGLGKSTRWMRDGMAAGEDVLRQSMSDDERARQDAIHKAVAWSLDAERFLGSFSHGEPGRFLAEHVDAVATHLLLWLHTRGFQVVPLAEPPTSDS